jgi:hypothetical protein
MIDQENYPIVPEKLLDNMKRILRLLFYILISIAIVSCHSGRHHVGNTREAAKSQRNAANRVGTQFIGIK